MEATIVSYERKLKLPFPSRKVTRKVTLETTVCIGIKLDDNPQPAIEERMLELGLEIAGGKFATENPEASYMGKRYERFNKSDPFQYVFAVFGITETRSATVYEVEDVFQLFELFPDVQYINIMWDAEEQHYTIVLTFPED